MNGMWMAFSAMGCIRLVSLYANHQRIMRPGSGPLRAPRYRASLIVPALNEEKYIGELLESAAAQSEPFTEIVVADSGDDATGDIARKAGAKVVRCERGNVSVSRNAGAKAAKGDVLVFADADKHLAPEFLETCLDYLENGAVLAYPREVFSDSTFWNVVANPPRWCRDSVFTPVFGVRQTSGCVAVWRNAFFAVGGYDANCNPVEHCWEDVDFGRRIGEKYGKERVRLTPCISATSARRWKKMGPFGGLRFSEEVRGYREMPQG